MTIKAVIPVKQVLEEKSNHQVYVIGPQTMVIEALMLMEEHNIGALVVMEDNKILGIFSERDYARKGIIKGRKAKSTPVTEVMTKDVPTVTPGQDVNHCMHLFLTERTRYLPVVVDEAMIGFLSMGDVLSSMIKNQRNHIEFLEQYITGY